MADRRRLDSLTALRFFAALAVVGFHGGQLVWRPLLRVTSLGYTGVAFFFVLSGFVLTWSHQPHQFARRFWRNRFARVWPLHALTWALVVATITGVGGGPMASLGLVQAWVPHASFYFAANGPSWSLSCEAFFYLCFPLVVTWVTRRRRLGITAAAVLGSSLVTGVVLYGFLSPEWAYWAGYILPVDRLGEFVLGAVMATAVARGWRPPWTPRLAVVMVGVAWVAVVAAGGGESAPGPAPQAVLADLVMIPAFAALIAAAATRDADGRTWLSHPHLIRLGEWSFALYLIHQPIMRLMRPGLAPLVDGIALAILCSAAVYRWVEKPLERRIRGGSRIPGAPIRACSIQPAT